MMRSAIRCTSAISVAPATDDGEFVAAEPPDQILRPHQARQPRGDVADQFVADRMTERVVDVLEMIEIDIEDGGRRHRRSGLP